MNENAVILFLKLPSKGKVKTRLEKDLGAELVFKLYDAFIADILSACNGVNGDTIIAYAPDSEAEGKYKTLTKKYRSFKQRGDDLGERMFNAFNDAYRIGYKRSVLIGSDIPDISSNIINNAFNELKKYDAAIGPSADGGYYLIGNNVKSNDKIYFKDIEWSKPDVYKKTEDIIKSAGYTLTNLEIINDIDDLNDLVKFYEKNKNNSVFESIRVILNNMESIFK